MPMTKDSWLQKLRSELPEVSPEDVRQEIDEGNGLTIVDVREGDEYRAGHVPGAIHLPRGFLELQVEKLLPEPGANIVAYCAGGVRSLFATETLRKMGYANVRSMAGGFTRWKQNGHPFDVPEVLSERDRERYARHLSIDEVGEEGQLKLLKAKVLCIGAGGLGSPAAYYLAAAGIGTLGIIDDDVVDRSNLQRQILHTDDRVGELKTESARRTLLGLNPDIDVRTYDERLTSKNIDEIVADYDIILDGCDNFPTRYLVNDACVKHRIPNVHGSIYRFEGQATVFWPGRGPCYRCLFPEPPPPDMAPSCAEAGVLGVLPGVIGVLEAIEVIKIVLGKGETLVGRLLMYDALEARFREIKLRANPDCAYCAPGREFPGYVDYEHFCGV